MLAFLQFIPFLILVLLANYAERQQVVRYVVYALLALIDAAFLAGAFLFAVAGALAPRMAVDFFAFPGTNMLGLALVLFLVGAVGLAVLVPSVRRWIARFTDTNPASPVGVVALSFAAYYIGASVGQVLFVGGLEGLAALPLETTAADLLLTGLAMVLFGVFGVGWPIRRAWGDTLRRLGLRLPTLRQAGFIVGAVAGFLALDYLAAVAWHALAPEQYDLIGRVSLGLFGEMSVAKAAAIGLSAGIGEEILFRGAVQPRFGPVITALLFTAGHTQYGLSPATLEIFVIGIILGIIRNRANTTTCIAIHVLYNFVDILLLPLFP
ncbi:MAG: CPBP family intramembrane metalloprotease [Anaerolineae bacterium]|nr:CPBP family intramembrane metalloprotease [Anaerolineae bacterium]